MRHDLRWLLVFALALALALVLVGGARDLAPQDSYPVPPRPLPDAEEIALATSAAPAAISGGADVYAIRGSGPVKLRAGTNGIACMVSRDLHGGSSYPICFDREAARTVMQREVLENTLRSTGLSEGQVQQRVKAKYADGTLKYPARPAISYMMSPRQILFSDASKDGRRVGPWHPHLMISMPNLTPAQLGLDSTSNVDVLQIDRPGEPDALLIVKVPSWSDGSPAH